MRPVAGRRRERYTPSGAAMRLTWIPPFLWRSVDYVFGRIPLLRPLYAWQLADSRLEFRRRTLTFPGLPLGLDGVRLVHLSDLHAGPFAGRRQLGRVLDRVAALDADLFVITGDFVSSFYGEIREVLPILERLRARHGVWAVLGNHDFYTGRTERLTRNLRDRGVRVLRNEHAVIEHHGSRLALIGLDDPDQGQADLLRATDGLPGDAFRVLLCHNPDIVRRAAQWGIPLVLCGHTHGGQFQIPGWGAFVTQTREKRDHGLFEVEGTRLSLTRGIGVIGLPLRWRCPPEVSILSLSAIPSPHGIHGSAHEAHGSAREGASRVGPGIGAEGRKPWTGDS